jgi:N-acetylglucosamine kinase-like BadF-type ATPase
LAEGVAYGVADGTAGPAAVLAIDGGNSKTDVALIAADGTLLASLRGPGASQEEHGIDGSMRILADLVRAVAAQAGVTGACVARHTSACLAGADLPEEEEQLTAALRRQGWSDTAIAVNDTFAVLRAGLRGDGISGGSDNGFGGANRPWGVAVTCGAGINCVAIAPDGRTARYLALGGLTGDWGGGHGLGQAIMWHAMRAEDGRGPATALGAAVAAHFGLASVTDVAIALHRGQFAEDDLLRLTPVLFTAAAAGDPVARNLVVRQASEVCLMATNAMRRLALPFAGTQVILGGGLLEARHLLLAGEIERLLAAAAPGAAVRVVNVPPVAGAALLGLDFLGARGTAETRLLDGFGGSRPTGATSSGLPDLSVSNAEVNMAPAATGNIF